MKKLSRTNLIRNNQGSVMLTVIVAFLFISVLVAIIMPLTVMAYRMKAVERETKDEFYYVERALDDVYSGVGRECSLELGRAYSSTLAKYEFTDNTLAYEQFHYNYVDKLKDLLIDETDPSIDYKAKLVGKFNAFLTSDIKDRAEVKSINEILFYDKVTKNYIDKGHIDASKLSQYSRIKIEGLYVVTKGRDYISSITTDLVIEIPTIDFFKVNEKDLDYALVGCKGIEFLSDATVTGNVYGGAKSNDEGIIVGSETTRPKVTINADYVVSGGDITINQGDLSISSVYGSDNEIWFENLIFGNKEYASDKNAKATINGNLYALNDLQIEGKNADVTIEGNYFGYGDEGTTLSSKESVFKQNSEETYDDDMKHSQSSSIIVNSSGANLDMKKLRTLVLLGQAYIDHNSNYDKNDNETYKVDGNSKINNDETGESAAMKASQELLLVPEEFLNTSNPTVYPERTFSFESDKMNALKTWVSTNFTNVELHDDLHKEIKLVKKGSKYYAYCYLKFKDQESEKNYIEQIIKCDLNVDDPSAAKPSLQTIKRRILAASIAQNSNIVIGNDDTTIYTKKGTILTFDKDSKDLEICGNTTSFEGYNSSSGNLYNKYKYLDTYLDYNSDMSKSVNSKMKEDVVMPFGRIFWKKGIQDDASTPIKTEMDGVTVLVYGGSELDLNSSDALGALATAQNALVIVDGDLVVSQSTTINGFIICSGKITVKQGATLTVNTDLSSLQKRLGAEIKKVKSNLASNPSNVDAAYEKGYLIRYLLVKYIPDSNVTNPEKYYGYRDVSNFRRYQIKAGENSESTYDVNTDYTQFITVENWKKTGAGGQ